MAKSKFNTHRHSSGKLPELTSLFAMKEMLKAASSMGAMENSVLLIYLKYPTITPEILLAADKNCQYPDLTGGMLADAGRSSIWRVLARIDFAITPHLGLKVISSNRVANLGNTVAYSDELKFIAKEQMDLIVKSLSAGGFYKPYQSLIYQPYQSLINDQILSSIKWLTVKSYTRDIERALKRQ